MAFLADLWGEAWVVLSLAGYLVAAANGPLLLKRGIERAIQEESSGQLGRAEQAGHRYLRSTNFDYSIMIVVIALMVFKPTWTDIPGLVIAGAVTVLATVIFLVPTLRED